MNTETPGRIVGWQVAVTEGAKVLPRESNPYAGQEFEDQLNRSREDAKRQDLQLSHKISFALFLMQEIRQASPDTALSQLGIDTDWTIFEDPTRQNGAFVQYSYWNGGGVCFDGRLPDYRGEYARFRASVVVDVP